MSHKNKSIARLPLDEVLEHALTKPSVPFSYGNRQHVKVGRLHQFAVHGCKCHFCGLEGNTILVTKDGGGGHHADLYHLNKHGNRTLMNRDHILPASLGGSNSTWNMRPTCEACNTNRGNTYTDEDKKQVRFNKNWSKWHTKLWIGPPVPSFIHNLISVKNKYRISKMFAFVVDFL
jgi:hypothetical protein